MSVATRLGRYRIGERIGTGGVADVYRAQVEGAAGFAKTLVVKCLRPHVADEPELVQALAREAKLAQRLQHGNIVQVLDFERHDDQPFVVMEYVDGCSLHELQRDLTRRSESIGLEEALFVVEELAAALRYLHAVTDEDGRPLDLVHRDVKPRNVLVSREGVVKLTDFGIAKVAGDRGDTLPGMIKGTPAYLSPEQARGEQVDARADLFALGLVMQRLLGTSDDAPDALPPDPRIDDELHALVGQALAPSRADRFDGASSMLGAIQRWRASHGIQAEPGRLAEWVRRAQGKAPLASAIALDEALLGGPAPAAVHAREPVDAPDRLHPTKVIALGLVVVVTVGVFTWLTLWATRSGSDPNDEALASLASGPQVTAEPVPPASPEDPPAPREAEPHATPSSALGPPPSPPSEALRRPGLPQSRSVANPTRPPRQDPEAASASSASPASASPASSSPGSNGRLTVNVLPWAEVSVDGRPLGRTPIDIELRPGTHHVVLHNPQLGSVTKTIELLEDEIYRVKKW